MSTQSEIIKVLLFEDDADDILIIREILSEANNTLFELEIVDRLHRIIQQNPDAIIVVDSKGTVRFINPAVESLFGHKASEILGELFGFPLVEDKKEIKIHCKDGRITTAEMRVTDIEWEGKPAHLLSLRDITERVRVEKEKLDFLSAISHELRTPLTSINNAVTIMETTGELNENQKQFLSMAIRNIDRLNKLVSQILNVSKMESGTWKFNFQMVDIKSLAVCAASNLKHLADCKEIRIIDEIPDKLPRVYADKDSLEQGITNLIENAIKYTPKDGLITLEANVNTHYIQVSISDTGIGISPEDQQVIFDKFKQVNSPLCKAKGFGLGLAIVKNIIENHKGKIWVESKIGKGSKFNFTLPLGDTQGLC